MDKEIKKRIEDYARNHSSAPDKETPDWIIRDVEYGYGLAQEEIARLKQQVTFAIEIERQMQVRIEQDIAEIARLTAQNERMRECLRSARFMTDNQLIRNMIESILNDK
jgi:hypothetical protein